MLRVVCGSDVEALVMCEVGVVSRAHGVRLSVNIVSPYLLGKYLHCNQFALVAQNVDLCLGRIVNHMAVSGS